MALGTKTFTQMLQDWAAAAQGACNTLLDFAIGAILRAISEAQAGVGLWLESLILQLLVTTRLSTSSGTAVDTFVGDFGLTRLGAVAATGQVTFSRYTPTNAATIPVGTLIQTADGTQTFQVIADTTQSAYSASLNAYVIPAGTTSITATVQAVVGGTGGNISAGTLTVLQSAISGVDTVSNAAAFTNGSASETDAALKARFQAFILGLSRGDYYGLETALLATGLTVQWTLTEGYNYNGSVRAGYYFVVADDGTGSPSAAFMQAIWTAVFSVRPLGIQAGVFPPTILNASVSMAIVTAAGYVHNTVCAQVAALGAANINALGLGNGLPWSILSSWAYSVPGVIGVSDVYLNDETGDSASIAGAPTQSGVFSTAKLQTIKCNNFDVS